MLFKYSSCCTSLCPPRYGWGMIDLCLVPTVPTGSLWPCSRRDANSIAQLGFLTSRSRNPYCHCLELGADGTNAGVPACCSGPSHLGESIFAMRLLCSCECICTWLSIIMSSAIRDDDGCSCFWSAHSSSLITCRPHGMSNKVCIRSD